MAGKTDHDMTTTPVADLTTPDGGPMFDTATRNYLRALVTTAPSAAEPWRTGTCPECGEQPVGDGLVVDNDGVCAHVVLGGAVVLGCHGYWVVNPAALGMIDLVPRWSDWRLDEPGCGPGTVLSEAPRGDGGWTDEPGRASPYASRHDFPEQNPLRGQIQMNAESGQVPRATSRRIRSFPSAWRNGFWASVRWAARTTQTAGTRTGRCGTAASLMRSAPTYCTSAAVISELHGNRFGGQLTWAEVNLCRSPDSACMNASSARNAPCTSAAQQSGSRRSSAI